jgi:hypothetical protein
MQGAFNHANDAAFCDQARPGRANPMPLAIACPTRERGKVRADQGKRNVPSTIVTDGPPIHVLPRASS